MTRGTLGIIACPMLDDNLVYSLSKDGEKKNITVVRNEYDGSLVRKLDEANLEYDYIGWKELLSGGYRPDKDEFNIIILMINLGLHSKPKELKTKVEDLSKDMAQHVDAFGFYLGTCGNYGWNIPQWSEGVLKKPGVMFCDKNGNLCDDCVGVAIAGGPRYLEMQKKYPGHLYLFPAMATNFDDFMNADQADSMATEASLTDEIREQLGIEPGKDGYLRWLLRMGDYKNILILDTGLGDHKEFEECSKKVAERTALDIKYAEEGWATLEPTDDIYIKCKSLLED